MSLPMLFNIPSHHEFMAALGLTCTERPFWKWIGAPSYSQKMFFNERHAKLCPDGTVIVTSDTSLLSALKRIWLNAEDFQFFLYLRKYRSGGSAPFYEINAICWQIVA